MTHSAGMSTPGLEFQNFTTKYHILKMNETATDLITTYENSIIDLGFMLQSRVSDRNVDGIHWQPEANRSTSEYTSFYITLFSVLGL